MELNHINNKLEGGIVLEFKQEIIEMVVKFARTYNLMEEKYRQIMVGELKSQLNEYEYTDWTEKFTNEFRPIWKKYITDKERKYGGVKRVSIGYPGQYYGIENENISTNILIKSKYKVEVFIKTPETSYNEYLFICIKKRGIWKIDSYKQRTSGQKEWDNQTL